MKIDTISNVSIDSILSVPSTRSKSSDRPVYTRLKRCFDVALTVAIAPFAIAVVAIAAMLIRIEGGTAFYSQMRIGKDGNAFRLWKLRSMHPDADRKLEAYLAENPVARIEWSTHQKLRHDPRITGLGRVLRKYSIDELPQLLNVFRGEMSLVGPRPIMPEQRQDYPGTAYYSMRPGLTGLWQISERNGCTFAERARHDNAYAVAMSFTVDLEILARTALVVFRGTGL